MGRSEGTKSSKRFFQEDIRKGVLCHKGSWFRASAEGGRRISLKLTFEAAKEEIREGTRRIGKSIRSVVYLQAKDVQQK